MQRESRRNRIGSTEGFILACVVFSLAIVMAPSYLGHLRQKNATSLANEFRTLATAFRTHAMKTGEWPRTTSPGQIPPEISKLLPREFKDSAPGGGKWAWECDADQNHAGISLTEADLNMETIRQMDLIIDDGDIATGHVVYNQQRLILLLDK